MIKGIIFDLDGVIVDTAKYHYLAWRKLANKLGIDFSEEENENLKGVSRMESLEYILRLGKVDLDKEEKNSLAALKNEWYVEYISDLDRSEILPGVKMLLDDLKENHVKIALGSASKNSVPILKSLGLFSYFDFISDGNSTSKSKPDPEVFLIAAKGIELEPNECLVVEDSISGIEAALKGGFRSLGIGDASVLTKAEHVLHNLEHINWEAIKTLYK